MKPLVRYFGAATLLFLGMNPSLAQPQPPAQDKAAEKPKEEKKPPTPEEKIVQTKHSLKVGGQEIKYTATAGSTPRATSAGLPRNFLPAKAMAPHAPRASPAISSSVTACTSMASS